MNFCIWGGRKKVLHIFVARNGCKREQICHHVFSGIWPLERRDHRPLFSILPIIFPPSGLKKYSIKLNSLDIEWKSFPDGFPNLAIKVCGLFCFYGTLYLRFSFKKGVESNRENHVIFLVSLDKLDTVFHKFGGYFFFFISLNRLFIYLFKNFQIVLLLLVMVTIHLFTRFIVYFIVLFS